MAKKANTFVRFDRQHLASVLEARSRYFDTITVTFTNTINTQSHEKTRKKTK